MPATPPAATAASDQFLGHPKGLYVCFLTEMWERFAFYGMKALLLLYLIKHHLFSDTDGYLLLGTYAGLAYALPLLGGLLADRYLGMRKAVIFGGSLLVLGQLGMAWTGHAATGVQGAAQQDATAIQIMYFSLALIGVGVGFLKPNISTIVGRLYPDNDPRRDSGFTIFYMGINVGAFLSSLIVGYVGISYGWGWGFGLSGVMMALGLVQFVLGRRHLLGQAEPPASHSARAEWLIYAAALVGVLRDADGLVRGFFAQARGVKTATHTMELRIGRDGTLERVLMFDDAADPYQLHNLAPEEHPALFAALRRELAVLLRDNDDVWFREGVLSDVVPYDTNN